MVSEYRAYLRVATITSVLLLTATLCLSDAEGGMNAMFVKCPCKVVYDKAMKYKEGIQSSVAESGTEQLFRLIIIATALGDRLGRYTRLDLGIVLCSALTTAATPVVCSH